MQYIIDKLTSDSSGNTQQSWHGVYPAIAEAESAYINLTHTRHIIAAALSSWAPGNLKPNGLVIMGNYSTRSCSGGIPVATMVKHGCRTHISLPYTNHGNSGGYISLNDWTDEYGPLDITTQPSPGFKLGAKPRTESDINIIKHPNNYPHDYYSVNYKSKEGYKTYYAQKDKKSLDEYIAIQSDITDVLITHEVSTQQQNTLASTVQRLTMPC